MGTVTDESDKDFEALAQAMSFASRPGDLVRVNAPPTSMAAPYNGHDGEIQRYAPGGWVIVRVEGMGDARFRADELLAL
jgi:hypothetical protein